MLSIRALRKSQNDWGGSAACTVCCCMLSRYILLFRDQIDFENHISLEHIDSAISEAVDQWQKLSGGFMYPGEVLLIFPELAEDLRVVSEIACNVSGTLYDEEGYLIVLGVREVLENWNLTYSSSTTCVIVCDNYTFMLFKIKANYHIIDTHSHSIERHAHKISEYAQVEKSSSGLLLSTLFFAEILGFIQKYAPFSNSDMSDSLTSSNQIDLTYLALIE